MNKIEIICEFDTKLCADCIAWCPIKDYEKFFVCTTYHLIEGVKSGSILLFSLCLSETFHLLQTISDLPGILDAKWKPHLLDVDRVALATVDSDGYVTVYALCIRTITLVKISSINIFPGITPSPLALYIEWSPHDINKFVVSSSNGYLTIMDCDGVNFTLFQQWKCHTFETWVATFDENNPNILYSGGDDSIMKCYDYRVNPILTVWKSSAHSAGITSFMTSNLKPNQFASGSYDEYLKLWDTRMLKPESPLSDVCLEGGVWRMKISHYKNYHAVIAACMYAGFKLLQWNKSEILLLDTIKANENCLAYGVDWVGTNSFAACSFYDHKLIVCRCV